MILVYKKELRHLFSALRTYAAIAIVLSVYGFYTVFTNMRGSPELSAPFMGCFPALVIAVPAIGAALFSQERKGGTQVLLYSYSVTPTETVLGKYLAALTALGIPMALSALTPLLLSLVAEGEIDMAKTYFAWLGFFLLGCAMLAVVLLLSAAFSNAWVSFGVGVGLFAAFYLCELFLLKLPHALRLIAWVNPFHRYTGFIYGHFDLEGIVYFLSVTVFFVTVTALLQAYRRDTEY